MTDDSPLTKAEFRTEMAVFTKELREYIDERTHDAETRLLRAFSDYQNSHNIRFTKLKADQENLDSSADRRLASLEERVTNLDKRLILKNI
jgi:uncharacterized protein YceH (UPF0502 family)